MELPQSIWALTGILGLLLGIALEDLYYLRKTDWLSARDEFKLGWKLQNATIESLTWKKKVD